MKEVSGVLVMFHILIRVVLKQACSLCKSSPNCMLKMYAFYSIYV